MSGLMSWIVLLAIATGVLALGAAHLPAVAKKLGLFAIAYGLLVGLIGAWLLQFAPGLRGRRKVATAFVVALAVAGEIGIAVESYRIDRTERQRRELADPKQALAHRLLESAQEPDDPKSRATFDEFRRSYAGTSDSFAAYLQFRVSGVGIQSQKLAVTFWVIEVLLGGLTAGWGFLVRTRPEWAADGTPSRVV